MSTSTGLRAAAAAVLAVGLLTACGGEEPESATPAAERGTEEATTLADDGMDTGATEEGMAGAEAGTSVTTTTTDLGTFLVDEDGMTLYLFTNDSPGVSNCEGECLEAWPPLVGEPTAGEGVDEALLGTITRSDGTVQASYNDWPLYYYASDTAPGDVTGQGVNDVWWVVSPEGEAIMDEAMSPPGY